jgi:hypothetical protein
VYDLLDEEKRTQSIEHWTEVQLFESENGIILKNLNVFEVSSVEDALQLFFMGNKNRITSATVMNNASSRSHAIFTIVLQTECFKDGNTVITSGKINFVDLAGSERMYKVSIINTAIIFYVKCPT